MLPLATERNIARYLPRMARERPNQVAVVTGVGRNAQGQAIYDQLTFAELDRESDRYAWGITGYGINRGARVLLMVRAGLPLLSLTFALFKAGCVPILIDPAMGRRNLIACSSKFRRIITPGRAILMPDEMRSIIPNDRNITPAITVEIVDGLRSPRRIRAKIEAPNPLAIGACQ